MRAPALAPDSARLLRAAAQALASGVRLSTVGDIIGRVFAIQAQDADAAALGLRVRGRWITTGEVTRAYQVERSLVRGWFLRGTIHAVPAADVRWLTALTGPIFLKAAGRRLAELGLNDQICQRAENLILDALAADGPLTRGVLTRRLARLGVPERGQQAFHLIRRTALRGLVCFGPVVSGESTFARLDDWTTSKDPGWSPEQASAELARRYLAGYAPAGLADFRSWSGLPTPLARPAWQRLTDVVEVEVAGQSCTLPVSRLSEIDAVSDTVDVRLLPAYDNYLLGYRTRTLAVPASHHSRVWPGGGQITPTVLVNGQVVGTWTRRGSAARAQAFQPFDPPVEQGVAAEAADIARFLGG